MGKDYEIRGFGGEMDDFRGSLMQSRWSLAVVSVAVGACI